MRISYMKGFQGLTGHNRLKIRLLKPSSDTFQQHSSQRFIPLVLVMGSALLPKATHGTLHSPEPLEVVHVQPKIWSSSHLILVYFSTPQASDVYNCGCQPK